VPSASVCGVVARTPRDEALITAVYAEHGRALLAYATRLTGDRATAEDVVQETLVRVWKHPDVLVNGRGSVRGWLLTVVRNIVIDRARARSSRPPEVTDDEIVAPIAPDHAGGVVDSLTVLAALEQLSPEHRGVLAHLYFAGRTLDETAQVLGVPPGTVRSRSHYALKALRRLVESPAEVPA
jgi:RNA polymerase sigma-70 factor (ECF subfamily)